MARIQAELGAGFAAIGDDVGLGYSVRRLVAQCRFALAVYGDLQAQKQAIKATEAANEGA